MSWVIAVFAVLLLVLALQLAVFERGRPAPRALALIAALSALAIAGRLAFAPLPNIKPTTDIILIGGFTLGAAPGFAVGAITALVSNMAFGQGPWTPWQMFAWGLAGIAGALLARVTGPTINRWVLALAAIAVSLLFGTIMDLSQWVTFAGEPKMSTLIAYMATSLPWNIAHAAGSAAFALAFGPLLIRAVQRVTTRAQPQWLPVGSKLTAHGLPALLAVAALIPVASVAGSAGQAALAGGRGDPVAFLMSAQNADGGFGSDRGSGSSPMYTDWAALALYAAGKDLALTARPGGLSVEDRLLIEARRFGSIDSGQAIGAEQRLLLVVNAIGRDPRNFGGLNLVSRVRGRIGGDGSVGSMPSATAFAILALRGAGVSRSDGKIVRASRWLADQASRGAIRTVDDAGAALQALASSGQPGGKARAVLVRQIASARAATGGYPDVAGNPPNPNSTAWAIQGLIAVDADPAAVSRARSWLARLARQDGRIVNTQVAGSSLGPVFDTAQAVIALEGGPFPFVATGGPVAEPGSGDLGSGNDPGPMPFDPSADPASAQADAAKAEAARQAAEQAAAIQLQQSELSAQRSAAAAGRLAGAFVRAFTGPNR